MSIIKRTTSPIGLSIQKDIESFISDNAKALEQDMVAGNKDSDPVATAAKALSHAIAYGVAKGLASSGMQSAFSAGICPPSGGPVGTLIFNVLKAQSTETM